MSAIVKPEQSSHWYSQDGTPRYDATLREARKELLLPSVTTVIKEIANPGLEAWKQEQIILSALTLPRKEKETDDEFAKRVIDDSRSQAVDAAQLGSKLHDLAEHYLRGESVSVEKKLMEYWYPMRVFFEKIKLEPLLIEEPLVNTEYGYAGRVDVLAKRNGVVETIDLKTSRTNPKYKVKGWDSWMLQIAANMKLESEHVSEGGINIVISTSEPGRIEIVEWSPEDIERGFSMFLSALNIFRRKRKFEYEKVA
jgi:hypothetical protein